MKHVLCHLVVAAMCWTAFWVPARVAGQSLDARFEILERQVRDQDVAIRQLEAAQADHAATLRRLPGTDTSSDIQTQDDLSADDRLDRLEQSVLGFEEGGRDFVEALSTLSNRTLNGRIHLDHWGYPRDSPGINTLETGDPSSDPQDRFLNRRIRFGIRGTVPPANMSYRAEYEFSGRSIGGRVRDAWLGWDDLAWLDTVRIGNQKRPYGLDHLNSSNFNVFLERPFIVDAFNENNRRLGLVSYGASEDLALNWRYGVYNAVPIQNTNAIVGDDYQVEVAGRLASTWWYDKSSAGRGYGHLAISGTAVFPDGNAPNDGMRDNQGRFRTFAEGRSTRRWLDTGHIAGVDAYQLLGVEAVWNAGSLQIAGEFMNAWLQRDATSGREVNFHGAYVYVSYFLTGEHLPWNRELGILDRIKPFEDFFHVKTCNGHVAGGLGAWQLAMRLSYADMSDDDILGGIGQSTTMALNWYWNSHTRMQFNYVVGSIDDRLASLAGGGTAVVSGDYQIAGTRFMIDF